jgi:hypothetical protein
VGRPEGLVTGDRPVAVAILVGSLTHRVGGGGRPAAGTSMAVAV